MKDGRNERVIKTKSNFEFNLFKKKQHMFNDSQFRRFYINIEEKMTVNNYLKYEYMCKFFSFRLFTDHVSQNPY